MRWARHYNNIIYVHLVLSATLISLSKYKVRRDTREDKAPKVLCMGFEDYTLAGYRLYDPATRQFFHNSATFKEGLDIMEMSIQERQYNVMDL